MRKTDRLKKETGFTLIEMIIALTIVFIIAASLVPLMVYVTKGGYNNQNRTTANNLASSVMEKIRAMDYDSIGTAGGNPAGTIPQLQENVEFNGAQFEIDTLISWGAAKGKNENTNPVAFKNIRIIVKGLNPYTCNIEKLAELHSVVTRDGEEPLIENGHIRAWVIDSQKHPLDDPPVHIEIISPISQSMVTDYNGTALFGILESGEYNIRAKVEEELIPSPKETVIDGWIEKNNIEVNDFQITDVEFFMEQKNQACQLIIKLVDQNTQTLIVKNGKASITLSLDEETYTIYDWKAFSDDDFSEGCIPADFFGYLWSEGTYNIEISDVLGYEDYDLSIDKDAFLTNESELWNGMFEEPGTTLTVTIPMKSGCFYEEENKADFEDNTYMDHLTATDNDTLELSHYSNEVDPDSIMNIESSSSRRNSRPQEAFDGSINSSSYWQTQVSPNNVPQWIQCELNYPIILSGVRVYLSHNENNPGNTPNHKPKDFEIRVSMDGTNWDTIHTGTFPKDQYSYLIDFISPVQCQYFALYITSEYQSSRQGIRIYEIELFQGAGRNESGERLSLPISLQDHDASKQLQIEWEANVPGGTTFEVWTVVTEGTSEIPREGFKKVENGDIIPDIGYLENLDNKYLWILEKFTTNDSSISPVLDRLRITEEGP